MQKLLALKKLQNLPVSEIIKIPGIFNLLGDIEEECKTLEEEYSEVKLKRDHFKKNFNQLMSKIKHEGKYAKSH